MKTINCLTVIGLTLVFCTFSKYAIAQSPLMFPDISTESVSGNSVTLPKDGLGKHTIVAMAFSKKSEDALETWIQPVYDTFIKEASSSMFATNYDVNVYFIPMLGGAKQAAEGRVLKKLDKSVDDALKDHILIYAGNVKNYRETLSMEEKDVPYFFLLNESGEIVFEYHGAHNAAVLEEMEEILDDW